MKNIKALLLLTTIVATTTYSYDSEEAKEMYEADCTKCHDSKVFTRKETKVKNLSTLKKQVHRCVASQELSWFDEDEENVTKYLNDEFYKFKTISIQKKKD